MYVVFYDTPSVTWGHPFTLTAVVIFKQPVIIHRDCQYLILIVCVLVVVFLFSRRVAELTGIDRRRRRRGRGRRGAGRGRPKSVHLVREVFSRHRTVSQKRIIKYIKYSRGTYIYIYTLITISPIWRISFNDKINSHIATFLCTIIYVLYFILSIHRPSISRSSLYQRIVCVLYIYVRYI